MFVQAIRGECVGLGVGKQIGRNGPLCSIEYFDTPTSLPVVREVEVDFVERVTLAEQTRVYHFDAAKGAWEIGRLLDDHGDSQLVQFPNRVTKHLPAEAVFVRWDRPIEDPTPLLASRINESPRFSDT